MRACDLTRARTIPFSSLSELSWLSCHRNIKWRKTFRAFEKNI